MNAVKTYSALADVIGTFISHHPPGPLDAQDAILFGVLASLTNIQQGNDVRNQWLDIRALAERALAICEANEPGLFVGGLSMPVEIKGDQGEPGKADDAAAQQMRDLQACKNEEPRDPASKLTKPEAIAASLVAHKIKGTTLTAVSAVDMHLLEVAILEPTRLVFGQFIRLCQLLGITVEAATK